MNKDKAIGIMKQMASGFRGTLQEHQVIRQAIEFLTTLEEPKKTKPEKAPIAKA